jgi:hypothetical protein
MDHEEASQSETPLISCLPIEAHERPKNLKRKREDLLDMMIVEVKSHNERRRKKMMIV